MDRTAYICGPLGFVKAVQDVLTQLNVPKEKVKADVWG
jgi:ferredoxin-NADP reductase